MDNRFDIIPFINSAAIAEHCQAIGHSFSTQDMAYLIWASCKHSIREKQEAWRELIETMPDAEVAERPWTPHIESLHAFLLRYMELQDKYIALFYRDEPDCVYSYSIRYAGGYFDDHSIFPTFRVCLESIQADLAYVPEAPDIEVTIQVTKSRINRHGDETEKFITLAVGTRGEALDFFEEGGTVSEEDREILNAFSGMWQEIPTPFRRGDILTRHKRRNHYDGPFVLDAIPYWEDGISKRTLEFLRNRGDYTDLGVNVYRIVDDERLCRDHGPSYLDMEYYKGELHGPKRFLSVLSGFLMGEFDVSVMLEAYDYLKADNGQRALPLPKLFPQPVSVSRRIYRRRRGRK